MKVMKFGGTSLANWQRFSMAADIVAKAAKAEPVATVLSAPATVTNALLEMVDVAVKGEDYSSAVRRTKRAACTLAGQITRYYAVAGMPRRGARRDRGCG